MGDILPTGTVTFLFTDIESSTRYWEDQPEEMSEALRLHDEILRSAIESRGGYVFTTAGDSFAAAFSTSTDAAGAAAAIQQNLSDADWPETSPIRVRVGINTGEADERDGDYFGPPVNRAARLMSAAHGGQVLVSETAQAVLHDADLHDLGVHRLKDLVAPQRVWQLAVEGLPQDFPPINSLDSATHNLPVQRTELLGRGAEIEQVAELLSHHRLVTLTGFGGTGKTRLALAVAAEVSQQYPRGAFFVDLAPVSDGELVGLAALEAAGFSAESLSGEGTVHRQAADAMAGQDLLLVLDNCEHLVDDVIEYLDHLMDASDRPSVLATSREALEIDGEYQYRVRPLETDRPDSPAVQLFVERAAAAGMSIAADDPAVTSICRQVDGLPLAIELAAARAPMLGLEELDARLDSQLEILSARRRRRGRHRSLEALLEWSWDLLDEGEQMLLAQLGTFSGGWTLPAAEAVCDEARTVRSRLDALLSSSLVDRVDQSDSVRYAMLEPVRQFAVARLAERDDAEDLRARHLGWLVTMASAKTPGEQFTSASWAKSTHEDFDNLRAAVTFALENQRQEQAATLLGATAAASFDGGGHTAEFGRLLSVAIDSVAVPTARLWLAGALNDIGTGNHVRLAQRAGAALDAANREGDEHAQAMSQIYVAYATATIDAESATKLAESAVSKARSLDDPHLLAITLAWAGAVALIAGDRPGADLLLDEAVDLASATDSLAGIHAHLGLFFAALEAGQRADVTLPLLQAALDASPNSHHVVSAHIFEGYAYALEGNRPQVEQNLDDGLRIFERFGIPNAVADAALGVAELLEHEGNRDAARSVLGQLHRQALTTSLSYNRYRQIRERLQPKDLPTRRLAPHELHAAAREQLEVTA